MNASWTKLTTTTMFFFFFNNCKSTEIFLEFGIWGRIREGFMEEVKFMLGLEGGVEY